MGAEITERHAERCGSVRRKPACVVFQFPREKPRVERVVGRFPKRKKRARRCEGRRSLRGSLRVAASRRQPRTRPRLQIHLQLDLKLDLKVYWKTQSENSVENNFHAGPRSRPRWSRRSTSRAAGAGATAACEFAEVPPRKFCASLAGTAKTTRADSASTRSRTAAPRFVQECAMARAARDAASSRGMWLTT